MRRPARGRRHPAWLLAARDAELEAGSDAHYEDPAYYGSAYADRLEDVDYYVALAADLGGPVLEYGCGSGRITVPLARIGLEVTGIDRSRPMLAALRRQLRGEHRALGERITLRCADMRTAKLPRRFPLVLCTFNTLLHLYTRRDLERFCARVRAHLRRGGRFVVDASVPDLADLSAEPSRIYRVPRFRHPSTGEVVRYGERFDYDPLRQVLTIAMEFESMAKDGPAASWMTPLAHRQYFPQELQALLHYNGLEVFDIHGDFRFEAPTAEAVELVYHCRVRRGWRG
jgi:SAM-dependent methyltransferase